jgi:hypothetical protein
MGMEGEVNGPQFLGDGEGGRRCVLNEVAVAPRRVEGLKYVLASNNSTQSLSSQDICDNASSLIHREHSRKTRF